MAADASRRRAGGHRRSGRPLPAFVEYANSCGRVGILNSAGVVTTKGHPFFEPIGTNGRACVTCHQPADGMSLSVSSVQERWQATGGKDPLFAMIDGANCPNLPAGRCGLAFAAAESRPVPRRPAVATAR